MKQSIKLHPLRRGLLYDFDALRFYWQENLKALIINIINHFHLKKDPCLTLTIFSQAAGIKKSHA